MRENNYSDISAIIQGKLNENVIKQIDILLPLLSSENILISTWKDELDNKLSQNILERIPEKNLILNDSIKNIEEFNNHANRYFLAYTTLAGLRRVITKYVIKFRGDEYYSRIENLFEFFYQRNEKIVTTNVFFRPLKIWPYHIGDHVIIGNYNNVNHMFLSAFSVLEQKKFKLKIDDIDKKEMINNYNIYLGNLPFEVILTMQYLKFHGEKIDYDNAERLMIKYFDVYNVEKLKPFHIRNNGANSIYENNITQIRNHIILNMKDINMDVYDIDPNNRYTRMQKHYYEANAIGMAKNNHREHDVNPDYWNILLGDLMDEDNAKMFFQVNEKPNVLDFGCGCGRNVFNIIEKSPILLGGVDGVDISENNIQLCNELRKQYNIPETACKFYVNNGIDLSDLKSDEYTFVISTIVFQHIAVHEIRYNLMKEIYRVMKNKSSFSLQMGYGNSPDTVGYYENFYDATGTNSACDVRVENPEDLINDLKKIGFSSVNYQIRPSFSNTIHKEWIYVKAFKDENYE